MPPAAPRLPIFGEQESLELSKQDYESLRPDLLPTDVRIEHAFLDEGAALRRSEGGETLGRADGYSCFLYVWLAIDGRRQLVVTPWDADIDAVLKHPHITQGHDVQCAGFLLTCAGVLRYIDHSSGHFRPPVRHFLSLLEAILSPGSFQVEVAPHVSASKNARVDAVMRLCALPQGAGEAKRAHAAAAWLLRGPRQPAVLPSGGDCAAGRRAFVLAFWRDRGLLILRAPGGDFQLPGGRRDTAERIAECAARELFEETGIDLCGEEPLARLVRIHFEQSIEERMGDRVFFVLELEDADPPGRAASRDGLFVAAEPASGADSADGDIALRLSPEHAGFCFESLPHRAELMLWDHSGHCCALALRELAAGRTHPLFSPSHFQVATRDEATGCDVAGA